MSDRRDISYEEAVQWLHSKIGQRMMVRTGLGEGLPATVSFGVLQLAQDPRLSGEHADRLADETAEILAFGMGTPESYTAWTLSASRFTGARLAVVSGEEIVTIGQREIFVTVAPADLDLGTAVPGS